MHCFSRGPTRTFGGRQLSLLWRDKVHFTGVSMTALFMLLRSRYLSRSRAQEHHRALTWRAWVGDRAGARSGPEVVQRVRLCGAVPLRALQLALLHAQVLRRARGDALPQVCGVALQALFVRGACHVLLASQRLFNFVHFVKRV